MWASQIVQQTSGSLFVRDSALRSAALSSLVCFIMLLLRAAVGETFRSRPPESGTTVDCLRKVPEMSRGTLIPLLLFINQLLNAFLDRMGALAAVISAFSSE